MGASARRRGTHDRAHGAGAGREDGADRTLEISVLDVHDGIATAIVRSVTYREYLHLVRTDEGLADRERALGVQLTGAIRTAGAYALAVKIVNLHGDEWDRVEERPGWRSKDAHVGVRLGAELPAAASTSSSRATGSGRTTHTKRGVADRGAGAADAEDAGGRAGATRGRRRLLPAWQGRRAQVSNRTDAPIRVLMLSSMILPEIVEYLDSGKLGCAGARN